MAYIESHRFHSRLLLPAMLALLLSGCIRGLFEGDKTLLSPEIIKVTVPTETVKPPVKEAPATAPPTDQTPPKTPPKAEEKLLPQELSPQTPQGLMPIPPPAPAPSPPHSEGSPTDPVEPAHRTLLANPPDAVYRDAVLTEDMVWRGEVLVEGGVTVAPQTTLTVAPGTVVRFKKSGAGAKGVLLVQGRIMVKGTLAKPVLFTANFAEPLAGDWQGVVLLSSEKKNSIEHLRLKGAETGLDAAFSSVTVTNSFFSQCQTGVRLQDTLATLTGGGISSCGLGLALYDSEAELRDASINGNRQGGAVVRTSLALSGSTFDNNTREALIVESSRIRIAGAGFTSNGSGLRLAACDGMVTGSMFRGNAEYGLLLARSRVRVNGNEITGNGTFGLQVEDGQGIAWGNQFAGNGRYDVYNAGTEDFRAIGNWWEVPADAMGSRIYDRQANAGRGRVYYLPVLQVRPQTVP